MKLLRQLLWIVCIVAAPVSIPAADRVQPEAAFGLPPGTYGGAWQLMVIGDGGAVRFDDKLSLGSIAVRADGGLEATFPTPIGNKALVLQPSARELTREVWTATAEGLVYKATAIPYSGATYCFRLEIRRGDRLIAGAQVFCAICPPSVQHQE
ncbi:MAG TPA: hypothetical protein DCY13_03475 [Verrucomicrobiales bacterium]|nr:hypothetical protein [Verrucomicrobiales bacterium]